MIPALYPVVQRVVVFEFLLREGIRIVLLINMNVTDANDATTQKIPMTSRVIGISFFCSYPCLASEVKLRALGHP